MDGLLNNRSLAKSLFDNTSVSEGNESLLLSVSDNEYLFPFSYVVIAAFLMSLMSLTTVLGNTLVIVAFIVDKRLRNHSCYFLVNLAVCDFFVGSISIPWSIYPSLTGRWTHGRIVCKLWLTMDSTVCISSVYSILLISYDRFLSVTKAVSYRLQQGTNTKGHKPLIQIGIAWVIAFLLSAPAIIFWDIIAGHSNVPEGICTYESNNAWHFLISLSLLDFYAPFISIVYFNLSIYWCIKKHSEKRMNTLKCPLNNENAIVFFTQESDSPLQDQRFSTPVKEGAQLPNSTNNPNQDCVIRKGKEFNNSLLKGRHGSSIHTEIKASHMTDTHHLQLKKDKHIAKSLTVIVGLYFICWMPYILIFLSQAMCQGKCIAHFVVDITWWLIMMNSSINPFLYPLCHKKFKRAFVKILCCVV